jgi:hypothetical protein
MYRKLIKPFHKRLADIALENGAYLDRTTVGEANALLTTGWISESKLESGAGFK